MTYRNDFTLPTELMEQVQEQGLDVLPELIRVADPIWCPEGQDATISLNGCTTSFMSIFDLLNDMDANANKHACQSTHAYTCSHKPVG